MTMAKLNMTHMAGIENLRLDNEGPPMKVEMANSEKRSASKLEELRRKLATAMEDAEQSRKFKSAFLASMSHELRTPLNAVLGFGELLHMDIEKTLTPTQKEYIENILTGGNHLLELVDEVLDLTRMEAGHVYLALEELNPERAVIDCVALVTSRAIVQDIQIINTFVDGPKMEILADRLRIKQVISNLLNNAIDFNKNGGTITIEGAEIDDGYLRLSISDTGIGISEDDQSHIFEMFHSLEVESMIAVSGTGIGLSVAKFLVERMGGRIGFESEVGVGSTFWIELPLVANENMMLWAEKLLVNVKDIDNDHLVIFSLLDKVNRNPVEDHELDSIIETLITYTSFHFKREEAIMVACEYPHYITHRGIHRDLINRVKDLADRWKTTRDSELLRELRKLLRGWLISHISQTDTQIEPYTLGKEKEIQKALAHLNQQ